MKNYNEQLDELFVRWEEKAKENGHTGFCTDGLMYRGENWEKKVEQKIYYGKSEGEEDNLWMNAKKRILFLLKDTNNNPDCHNREFRPGASGSILLHHKNIAYWLFGILSLNEKNIAPDFDNIDFWNDVFPVFDTVPFAIVNCKKESGGSTITNEKLSEHIGLYADFIKEEIEILNPDIIICGGGSSKIKDFVKEKIYTDIEKIDDSNNWIYYSKRNNKVVIDSYHPSYWQIKGGSKSIYETMMSKYKEFLDKYPNFLKE